MLVLALQFSKGSERGRAHDADRHRLLDTVIGRVDRAGHAVGSGSASSMPCAEGRRPEWVDSLKTEEKTKLVEPACQEDESCD